MIIKTSKGYVAGFSANHGIVQFTQDAKYAKKFSSARAVNYWLDQHVNVGEGLTWSHDIKIIVG